MDITFPVSGTAFQALSTSPLLRAPERYTPAAVAVRAAAALNGAPQRRHGSGYAHVVTCDLEAACVVWAQCKTLGSLLLPMPASRDTGRALLNVVRRLERAIHVRGYSLPLRPESLLAAAPAPADAVPPVSGASPELSNVAQARMLADQRNAQGAVDPGTVAVAAPWPPDAVPGEEEGWWVKLERTFDGSTPGLEHRNRAQLRDPKGWHGAPGEYALLGSLGEPTRTWADMRVALTAQMRRYLRQFPEPAGEVDEVLAARTAALIVGDHYRRPGVVVITREHLLRYLEMARTGMPGGS